MIEQQIEEIKNAVQELLQAAAQEGENLSDEMQGILAKALEHAYNRITVLRQEQSQESPVDQLEPVLKETPMQEAMPSSNINAFNYDYDNGNLLIKFQGDKGRGQGPVYSYQGVQPYIFDLFKRGAAIAKTSGKNKWGKWWKGKSPSIGAAMHAFIKGGNYPYQKIK